MRSLYAVGLVVIAALVLVFCGFGDGYKSSGDPNEGSGATAPITLPPLPSGTNPSDGGDTIPTVGMQSIVGRTVSVISPVALKVQPNDLCKNNLVLIYYDAQNNMVREVLTAGEHIAPVNGVVSGLVLVKAQADVDVASVCQNKDDKSLPPSVVVAALPGFPKGLRLPVAAADNEPSLGSALLSDEGGKIKLSWSAANDFDGGAEVFFNSNTEGNTWTQHSGNLSWDATGGEVISTLDYTLPVKALVKVSFSDGGTHWLYFSQRS